MRLLVLTLAFLCFCGPALADVEDKVAAAAPSGVVLALDEEGNELVVQNAERSFIQTSANKA